MKERLKSSLILVLLLSLIWLALLNWFYWSDTPFVAPIGGTGAFVQDSVMDAARPISGDYDRYRVYLGELLAVADKSAEITRREWDAAVTGGGICFEFLAPVPIWLVAQGLSFTAADIFDGVIVYEMVLSENGLLVFDGNRYTHFSTPLLLDLPERAGSISDDRASFPYVETLSRFLEEPYLSEILESFGFNPNTNFRYTQPDGEMVVVDNARTLHINPNGRVVYQDGTRDTDETDLDEQAAIRLCLGAIPEGAAFWGDGYLVFNSTAWQGDEFTFSLTYILDGAVFLDWQTVFVVSGGVLRSAVIHLAPASVTDEFVRLMPRERAEVLALQGGRVYVGYSRVGENLWVPDWWRLKPR
jgi:hypothetical protein